MKVFLVSYATPEYYQSQARLVNSALAFGVDQCLSYNRKWLKTTSFYKENKKTLDQRRGGGFWLWKPFVILDALSKLSENDILIYSDSGVEIISEITPLVEICTKSNGLLFFNNYGNKCKDWTKRDCFIELDADNDYFHSSEQVMATFFILKLNKENIKFVQEWLNASTIKQIITDAPNQNGLENLPGFIEHRHDQSVLSILVRKLSLETFPPQEALTANCLVTLSKIINIHRERTYTIKDFFRLKYKKIKKMRSQLKQIVKNNPFLYNSFKPIHEKYSYLKELYENKGNSKLHRLGVKFKTDKVDKWHTFNNLSYLDIYETYFKTKKNKPINVLEIGVRGGNSVKIWKAYFKKAKIYGIDINPDCLKHSDKRINIFIGSQNDEAFLNEIVTKVGFFDIIIDDASHINELSIFSFNYFFKYLNSNGVYIIEDLATSYEDLNEVIELWDDELKANKRNGVNLKNERKDLDAFFADLIRKTDHNKHQIKSIQFWPNIAVIVKS